VTVKDVELVIDPPAVVTLILPVVAPTGTMAVIWVSESTVNVARMPLKVTALAPVRAEPVITTEVPTGPIVGEKLTSCGSTLKLVALAVVPPAVVTLIFPLAPQHGTMAVICVYESAVNEVAMLLNDTAVAPVKAVPVITTVVPDPPFKGLNVEICGMTLNVAELNAVPPGATTVIFPVSAPFGTVVLICVSESTVNGPDVPFTKTSVAPAKPFPEITMAVPTVPLVGVNDPIDVVGPPTCKVPVADLLPRTPFTVCRPATEAVQTFAVQLPSGVIVKVVPEVMSPRELP
jgi:hypothetical protein